MSTSTLWQVGPDGTRTYPVEESVVTTTRQIDHLERMNSSRNGNPRFRIYFTDGSIAVTQSDAGFCSGLENRENFGVDVAVTFTRAGLVSDLRPVQP